MLSLIVIIFIASLLLCALLGLPMIYAVLAGLLLFFGYGLRRGIPFARLLRVVNPGIRRSMIVIVVLLLIGIMSAAWRSSGLMALLIIKGLSIIYPPLFLLFVFLLCSGFSFIIGSSFGTASVMGVMLFTLGSAAGVNPLLSGGAILSGIYFGDRASVLSSSAVLVASLSQVDHKKHLGNMFRSSALPFILSALVYTVLSRYFPYNARDANAVYELEAFFKLDNPILLVPLVLVLLPVFTKLRLRGAILLSTLAAFGIAVLYQKIDPLLALRDLIFGYSRPIENPQLQLLYGGGILSILKPVLIIFFSGALPPLLTELGALTRYQEFLERLAVKTSSFFSAMLSGVLCSAIGCSQTLAVFLQAPLLDKVYPSGHNEQKALAIGSTSILLSGLVPWNIAMVVPLAVIGAPMGSGLFAVYLYLVPLVMLVVEVARKRRRGLGREEDTPAV